MDIDQFCEELETYIDEPDDIMVDHVRVWQKVLARVIDDDRAFYMGNWQGQSFWPKAQTEDRLVECGTAACAAGWLAVSPEFAGIGGGVGQSGTPVYGPQLEGSEAIAEFLGVPAGIADMLVFAEDYYDSDDVTEEMPDEDVTELWARVTAQDVYDRLSAIARFTGVEGPHK